MSKSLSINILLPLDQYNSEDVYESSDELRRIYSLAQEDGIYFKKLKIRSVYATTEDIRKYFREKYGITDEEMRNYSMGMDRHGYHYHFREHDICMTKTEYNALEKPHVDEGIYCLEYKRFLPDIYWMGVLDQICPEDRFVPIDKALIEKSIELITENYLSEYFGDEEEESDEYCLDRIIENLTNFSGNPEGKLLISLIIGKAVADRVGGIAVMEYD